MDYEEEFKSRCGHTTFLRLWPNYATAMRQFCDQKFNCEKHTAWADDIESVLLLMKALPTTGRGKKKPFKDLIDKMIIYQVVRFSIDFNCFLNGILEITIPFSYID